MLRVVRYVLLLLLCFGAVVDAQDWYRDWNQRVCPVLDTPFRTFRGVEITHAPGADTGTTGWGDSVSVTDVALWGRLPRWANDYGGELEVRGHADLRVLSGMKAGSGIDRQHGFVMLRGAAVWHQRYYGGVGLQVRMQPGMYTAVGKLAGNVFSVPVGATLVQAFSPEFAVFAGGDYYADFAVEFDPVLGLLYSRHKEIWLQLAYPETRLSFRPYGGRFAFGAGADVVRWPEYRLVRDDTYRRLRFQENQAYVALSWDTRGFTQFDVRIGYLFDRSATFEDGPKVVFADTPFVSIGFSALL